MCPVIHQLSVLWTKFGKSCLVFLSIYCLNVSTKQFCCTNTTCLFQWIQLASQSPPLSLLLDVVVPLHDEYFEIFRILTFVGVCHIVEKWEAIQMVQIYVTMALPFQSTCLFRGVLKCLLRISLQLQ